MLRIRTTLDSVTKAIGSTDLISKIYRLKPRSAIVGGAHADKTVVKAEPVASKSTDTEASDTTMKSPEEDQKKGLEEDSDTQQQRVTEKPFVATKTSKPSLAAAASASAASYSSSMAKQTSQSSALSANMDETYNTLAQHVNSYFGSSTHTQGGSNYDRPQQHNEGEPVSELVLDPAPQSTEGHIPVLSPVAEAKSIETPTNSPLPPPVLEDVAPPTEIPPSDTSATESVAHSAPVPSTSPKKGFTHYLSYIAKFRSDSKSVTAEEEKTPSSALQEAGEKPEEKTQSEEEEKAEKAKQLRLSQREKIIARVSVDNRTRALVKGLQRVTDVKLLTSRVEELNGHLLEFPETRGVAIKESLLPCLLRLRQARDLPLQAAVREALALMGYTDPVKGRGIRVLAIDGGGTRGLVALQTLSKLQILTGKPIHQLFDYICGVSTGAILAFMLAVFQIPLDECEDMYRKLGADVFNQNVIVGTVKMGWSHAFYNSEIWENILKERMGEGLMVESARNTHCPKLSAVSTIVNRGLPLKAYVFRNYRLMPGVRSHYLGDCKHKMWQAIRASSAAPGYFQEFVLGKDLHQDGGLLINNPTALAIHECKCLWPNTPVQCVVSLGTGRYDTWGKSSTTYTSLKAKLTNVISSATDTEEVHTMLDALLPPDTYFRFNPHLSEEIPLDESRLERLNFLKSEADRYLERNDAKLRKAASVLSQEKSAIQRLAEWAKLKTDMYEGLPFRSKL